jgi:hypothetical protein
VLTVDESTIPIQRVDDLAGFLREQSTGNQLQGSQRLAVVKLLTGGIQKPDEPASTGKGKGPQERQGKETKERRGVAPRRPGRQPVWRR